MAERALKIGVDLDNTLACYDTLFWQIAVDRSWIPREIPARKECVRDALRMAQREADWTLLQGEVYGPRMREAEPFEGAVNLFVELSRRGHLVYIVSHRTREPYTGPRYDLHASARQWLSQHGFLETHTGLTPEAVFLETSKAAKLNRMAELGLNAFIDDLPELLLDPQFPAGVDRILFDPHRHAAGLPSGVTCVHDLRAIPPLMPECQT